MLYSLKDEAIIKPLEDDPNLPPEAYRTPWRRDYGRLIHSPSFRRLQGKTQLFPGKESDFFRNRLTHSLEVAQIAKSIAIKLNDDLEKAGEKHRIEPDIVEFAGFAHDLGHPPFGHFGEEALDKKMANFGGFESNAQTLRILTTTEKRHFIKNTTLGIDSKGGNKRVGLNLTVRSLASILKYDHEIPFSKNKRKSWPEKGYYITEKDTVKFIKKKICNNKQYAGQFKTVECQIMDIADDIAYSVYDLEDSFKAGFIKPIDLICASDEVIQAVRLAVNGKLNITISEGDVRERIKAIFFYTFGQPIHFEHWPVQLTKELAEYMHRASIEITNRMSNEIAENAYARMRFTSRLVGAAIRKVTIGKINRATPALSQVKFEHEKNIDVEILKNIVYYSQILSPKIRMIAFRSKDIVDSIFNALSEKDGYMLMPDDFRAIYRAIKKQAGQKRVICDFIAGMTDRYALEFYGRLVSENSQTIFKPF